jgi:hypothetical protein
MPKLRPRLKDTDSSAGGLAGSSANPIPAEASKIVIIIDIIVVFFVSPPKTAQASLMLLQGSESLRLCRFLLRS